jgi:hypothetical protein
MRLNLFSIHFAQAEPRDWIRHHPTLRHGQQRQCGSLGQIVLAQPSPGCSQPSGWRCIIQIHRSASRAKACSYRDGTTDRMKSISGSISLSGNPTNTILVPGTSACGFIRNARKVVSSQIMPLSLIALEYGYEVEAEGRPKTPVRSGPLEARAPGPIWWQ